MSFSFPLPKIRGKYRFNVNLSKTNWLQVGGPAEILFLPKDIADLAFFLQNKPDDLPVQILGIGSNVIVKDEGVKGVVIKLLGGEFNQIEQIEPDLIAASAGCLCYNVALFAKNNAISDLEFLSGIPGNIGGALAMNAGCYGSEIADFLVKIQAVNFAGKIIELGPEDFAFSYRKNPLAEKYFFTKAFLRAKIGNKNEIAQKIAKLQRKRSETQPIKQKTGGSTFKNPDPEVSNGKKAWQLIDEAGCRGLAVGNAQISQQHCNFLINNGQARASDILELITIVQDKVRQKSGVNLEVEIKIIE